MARQDKQDKRSGKDKGKTVGVEDERKGIQSIPQWKLIGGILTTLFGSGVIYQIFTWEAGQGERLAALEEKRGSIEDSLKGIQGSIDGINQRIDSELSKAHDRIFELLKERVSQAASRENIRLAKQTVQDMIELNEAPVSSKALVGLGNALLDVRGEIADEAWDTLALLARYQSKLGAPSKPVVPPGYGWFDKQVLPPMTRSSYEFRGIAFTNAVATLDHYWLDDVIFSNSTIRYNGGPLFLRNVRFVNCTFEFRRSRTTERLVAGLLESNSPAFSHEMPDEPPSPVADPRKILPGD